MTADIQAYFDANSNMLKISNLKNAATGAPIIAGITITALIYPLGSATPVSPTPIAFTYVTGTVSDWVGVIPLGFAVALNLVYEAVIIANGGSALTGQWTLRFRVEIRRVGPGLP